MSQARLRAALALALAALVAAECPNGCSGHGDCGQYDSCTCYNFYQGNDCSERTCWFGIAHVDTPKGDLNSDGVVSGPLTTVLTGSEVYPWGTTEQYPNADPNEGHFYMECSNKGLCNRQTGSCECFDGYTGTACARQHCPNDCSGHGTCESIRELANMKHFDTVAHHAATGRVTGSSSHHHFDGGIFESYSYDLWDADKSYGCKCDPGYWSADCSQKKCAYGLDPLFYDNEGAQYQTTVIHLGSRGSGKGAVSGSFRIVFYDVFGERYVTRPIDASPTTTSAAKVQEALDALPGMVIGNKPNPDVTSVAPTAVFVSMASKSGNLGTGYHMGFGGGAEGAGAGLGTGHGGGSVYGPEFTVSFTNSPGVLRTLEVDTQNINNPGTTDYWVANYREGQFSTRYSVSLGRVNTLMHGSKQLYTSNDYSPANIAPANTVVKVAGTEYRIAAATSQFITLSEPFLGGSILPILIDTGALATHLAFDDGATPTPSPITPHLMTVTGVTTEAIAESLMAGAPLHTNDCPFVSEQGGTPAMDIRVSGTSLYLATTHDCQSFNTYVDEENTGACSGTDAACTGPSTKTACLAAHASCVWTATLDATQAKIIYRRSDDPSNMHLYSTGVDTGSAVSTGIIATRGSADVYLTEAHVDNTTPTPAPQYAASYVAATNTFTYATASKGAVTAVDTLLFVNGLGPMKASAIADGASTFVAANSATHFDADFSTTGTQLPIFMGKAGTDAGIVAGSVLLFSGRRYKVASRSGTAAKITLTEQYAGGGLRKVCTACVSGVAAAGTSITVSGTTVSLKAGDRVLVGDHVNEDLQSTVTTDVSYGTTIATSPGTLRGVPANSADGAGVDVNYASSKKNLYAVNNNDQTPVTLVVESSAATTFQYVGQCSNRGFCNTETGLCECFSGYSNHNCDTQNMLAM
eukprot:g6912.t1